MRYDTFNRAQLLEEIADLRKRLSELEQADRGLTALKKSLSTTIEMFRALFDRASECVLLMEVREGEGPVIIDANAAACAMHGYARQELIGRPITFLDTPETAARVEERSRRLLRGGELSFEGDHVRKDGSVFPVEVTARRITIGGRTYILGIDRNITERKRVEQALREERDKAQKYLSIAGVIFVIIDRDEKVELINAKGCEILGYEERDVIGRNWFDTFVPERMREQVRETFSALMSGNVIPVEFYENPVLTKDGNERIIAWHNTVLRDEGGAITGTLSSGEDITERKRNEAEKERLIEDLQGALAEIKSLKGMVPLCAMRTSNTTEAVQRHYESISRDGRCPECLALLQKK